MVRGAAARHGYIRALYGAGWEVTNEPRLIDQAAYACDQWGSGVLRRAGPAALSTRKTQRTASPHREVFALTPNAARRDVLSPHDYRNDHGSLTYERIPILPHHPAPLQRVGAALTISPRRAANRNRSAARGGLPPRNWALPPMSPCPWDARRTWPILSARSPSRLITSKLVLAKIIEVYRPWTEHSDAPRVARQHNGGYFWQEKSCVKKSPFSNGRPAAHGVVCDLVASGQRRAGLLSSL